MAGTDEIAVLRIELQGIEPLIWRRVAVRTSISLTDLHNIIQAVMGWLNSHLWELEASGRKYAMYLPDEPDWNERYENAKMVLLAAVLNGGVRQIQYVCDIGDYWEHWIIVEKLTSAKAGVTYPQFLGGERRCPPEDCGGVPGYYEFLKNIASKQKANRDHARVWYGGPYDANDMDEKKIVGALKRIATAGRRAP